MPGWRGQLPHQSNGIEPWGLNSLSQVPIAGQGAGRVRRESCQSWRRCVSHRCGSGVRPAIGGGAFGPRGPV